MIILVLLTLITIFTSGQVDYIIKYFAEDFTNFNSMFVLLNFSTSFHIINTGNTSKMFQNLFYLSLCKFKEKVWAG